MRDLGNYAIPGRTRYYKLRYTKKTAIQGGAKIPRKQRKQEVRDTRKYEIRGSAGYGHTKYQIPRSTRYQRGAEYKAVRDTKKCHITGRTRYTRKDDVPRRHRKYQIKVIAVGVLRYSNLFIYFYYITIEILLYY